MSDELSSEGKDESPRVEEPTNVSLSQLARLRQTPARVLSQASQGAVSGNSARTAKQKRKEIL